MKKGLILLLRSILYLNLLARFYAKNLHILYNDLEPKGFFSSCPMVTFRSARKLSSYLVRAKLYEMERIVGSEKCNGNGCKVCLNVNETKTFTSTVTNTSYKINHRFNCKDKCLVYLLTCKKCCIQYTSVKLLLVSGLL